MSPRTRACAWARILPSIHVARKIRLKLNNLWHRMMIDWLMLWKNDERVRRASAVPPAGGIFGTAGEDSGCRILQHDRERPLHRSACGRKRGRGCWGKVKGVEGWVREIIQGRKDGRWKSVIGCRERINLSASSLSLHPSTTRYECPALPRPDPQRPLHANNPPKQWSISTDTVTSTNQLLAL